MHANAPLTPEGRLRWLWQSGSREDRDLAPRPAVMSDQDDVRVDDRGSDALLVSFGGFHEGFTFVGLAARLGVDGVFLRDQRLDWYLGGVRGIGDDMAAVCAFLRGVISIRPRRRVVCIGQSSGGYAALRFALEIGPDAVIAFAPQTRPMTESRAERMSLDGVTLHRPDDRIADLGRLYRQRQPTFEVQVHMCESETANPPDVYFWDDGYHLRGLTGVGALEVVRHPCSFHPVAYHLQATGELDRIVGALMA